MPKSSKRFLLSNSSVNSLGFRLLTSGADLTLFISNPIMYWMHNRPEKSKDSLLPIGFWEDIKIEGDNITAIPNFDESDAFAMMIYNKVEHGTLRAASVGAEPIELGYQEDMLPGQTSATYIRWRLHEASIVDRGSNKEAVTLAYKTEGKTIEGNLLSSQLKSFDGEVDVIVNNALAVCKIDRATADKLLTLAVDEETANAVKSIVKTTAIDTNRLKGKHHPHIVKQAALSWDELMRGYGGVTTLKEHAPEIYKAKFFEKHGYIPTNVK